MHEVNELWSSPWRKLQQSLASGFAADDSGRSLGTYEVGDPGRMIVASWLVRARSRAAPVSPIQ